MTVPVSCTADRAAALVVPSSHTVYVNDADPVNPASGVYVIVSPAEGHRSVRVRTAAITAVTANIWPDSFAGPGVSFANSDAALIWNGAAPGAGHAVGSGDRRVVHLADGDRHRRRHRRAPARRTP